MDAGSVKIACGPICIALQYRDIDGGAPHRQGAGGNGGNNPDQGVCVQVLGVVEGAERELPRFDGRLAPAPHARCFLKNAIVRSQASFAAASL